MICLRWLPFQMFVGHRWIVLLAPDEVWQLGAKAIVRLDQNPRHRNWAQGYGRRKDTASPRLPCRPLKSEQRLPKTHLCVPTGALAAIARHR